MCTKCQVVALIHLFFKRLFLISPFGFKDEGAIPTVPILTNDRPYTIQVYDCANERKIEVLRVNIDKGTGRIDMGKIKQSSKVHPEESQAIKTTQVAGYKATDEPDVIEKDGDDSTNEIVDYTDEPERQQWSNPIEFLLSCIAMSVGLGSNYRLYIPIDFTLAINVTFKCRCLEIPFHGL